MGDLKLNPQKSPYVVDLIIKSTTVVDLTKKLNPQHGMSVVDLRSPFQDYLGLF
jgi:hypothetical protein